MSSNPESARLAHLETLGADAQAAALAEVRALPPAEATAVALALLEGMKPSHGTLVGMTCLDIVAEHGTPADLPRLRALRPGLPAIVALRDWRQDAGHTVAVLEGRARGDCPCVAVRRSGFPPVEERFETLAERPGDYCVEMDVKCRLCGRTDTVTVDYGYHYPTYRWH